MTPNDNRWLHISTTHQMQSNFVTPPDFVDNTNPNVLVIDADWEDVENVALWAQHSVANYNVYLYTDIMLDDAWLDRAIEQAHVIIVNTAPSDCSPRKNQLISDTRTWYYGPREFLGNPRQLSTPLDFFIQNND